MPRPDRRRPLGLLLRLAHQAWDQAIEEALSAAGFGDIRPSHANVFAFVPQTGIQVSDLARRARVRKQTMAQAIDELESLGYVERRPDPRDRRGRLVFLTARGKRVRPICVSAGSRVEAQWASLAENEVVSALRLSADRLLEALDHVSEVADTDIEQAD